MYQVLCQAPRLQPQDRACKVVWWCAFPRKESRWGDQGWLAHRALLLLGRPLRRWPWGLYNDEDTAWCRVGLVLFRQRKKASARLGGRKGFHVFKKLTSVVGDLLSDPVVEAPHFQCRGCKFGLWSGNWNPKCHMAGPLKNKHHCVLSHRESGMHEVGKVGRGHITYSHRLWFGFWDTLRLYWPRCRPMGVSKHTKLDGQRPLKRLLLSIWDMMTAQTTRVVEGF